MIKLDPAYQFNGRYIDLPLEKLPHLPDKLELDGRTYVVKSEFHASLVSVDQLVSQLVSRGLSQEAAEQRALEVATVAINRAQPKFEGYVNEIRFADRPETDGHTLVVMARVTGLEAVFADINQQLDLQQPTQQPHATLYIAENSRAIGIKSSDELAKWTRPLDTQTSAELTSQLDPYKTFTWSHFK